MSFESGDADTVDLPGISANAGENGPRPVRRPTNPGMLAPKNGRADTVLSRASYYPGEEDPRAGGYQPDAPARVGRLFPRWRVGLVFVTFFHAGVISRHLPVECRWDLEG